MDLFGTSSPTDQTAAIMSPLAQLLAEIQRRQQMPQQNIPASNGSLPAQQASSNNSTAGNVFNTLTNLQTLPWINTGQNMASWASALGQSMGGIGGSAISALAGLAL